jgi:hypothetical protein
MNDFDVVTGPAPGSAAAQTRPPSVARDAGKKLGDRGAAALPSLPSPPRGEGKAS